MVRHAPRRPGLNQLFVELVGTRCVMERSEAKALTKQYLAALAAKVPGYSVEVRVPPYGAVQAVEGGRHTRGTPRAVVETDPETWIALARGELTWAEATESGRVRASGERTDLSAYLPLT